MATITATNQQYYANYTAADQLTSGAAQGAAYHPQASAAHSYGAPGNHAAIMYESQQHYQHQHHQQQAYSASQMAHEAHLEHLGTSGAPLSTSPHGTATTTTNSTTSSLFAIEATKSTKGASKLRRDLINTEIAQLRELLPLPASTRQRLSQLQLMALVLVYVRKSNYFCNAFRNFGIAREPSLAIPTSGFSKALNGFIMMLTQKGKLLYISDNAAEYLGHSMEDLLSHGDEVYDIIEEQDKKIIRTELLSNDEDSQTSPSSKCSSISSLSQQATTALPSSETRIALCRMNVSRNARRQMRFGDQKVVLIEGHYSGGEHHLNCSKQQIHGTSWYELVKPEYLNEAQLKHKRITSNEQERSTIALLHLMNFDHSNSIWIHSVMQVKEAADSTTQPVIVCTNQVMSEREAHVMRANSWLYQFYSLHSKMHCNFASGSPADMDRQVGTPDSDCSNFDNERGDVKSKGTSAKLERPQTAINTSFNNDSLSTGKKSPLPSSTISATTARTKQLASPIKQSATTPSTCIYPNSYQQVDSTTALKHNKLAPQSPPSSASTISSSPILNLPSYTQQSNATGSCGYARALTSSNRTSATNEFKQGARNEPHYHNYAGSLGGSSSASSTSSVSSTSSLQSSDNSSASNVAQSMAAAAAAAAAAGNGSVAAAGLYAGGFDTTTIDPLQHMHHHAHHPGHPATMYSSTSNHHAGHQHHHHTAAAVNYASHMMAAQRVAHQSHHHHYHPYSHPQHHPSMHRTSHVAPHHHNHHTNPHAARAAAAAAALYAPAHHQVASLNGAFGHHQHAHSHHAAAYHSAAAVAAANVGQHPSHSLQASANTIPNPYHSSDAAAAAAAAAAHQGVSFHYNKIAAAVNASA